MSAGAVATAILLLAIFSGLYIVMGGVMDKYQVKNNEMISGDDYYSQNHKDAMNSAFLAWYGLPVAVILLTVIFVILESIRDKTGEI